jgi:hypothetical protein
VCVTGVITVADIGLPAMLLSGSVLKAVTPVSIAQNKFKNFQCVSAVIHSGFGDLCVSSSLFAPAVAASVSGDEVCSLRRLWSG